jgi:hypothetical protein
MALALKADQIVHRPFLDRKDITAAIREPE